MNKADKAESLFRTGYNCSQSVYAAFAEELGITVEEAAKKASPFGAGFGKLREVCGAVTGMVMVIGDLYGYDDPKDAAGKKQLYVLVQKLCGSFEASEGSLRKIQRSVTDNLHFLLHIHYLSTYMFCKNKFLIHFTCSFQYYILGNVEQYNTGYLKCI